MKKIVSILLIFAMIFPLTACNKNAENEFFYSGNFIEASFKIAGDKVKIGTVETVVKSRFEGYEALLDVSNENSFVAKLNASQGEFVNCSSWFVEIMEKALEVYEKTDGAFNPANYGLVKLWGFASNNQGNYSTPRKSPTQEEIQKALKHTDFSQIEIKGTKIRKLDPLMQFDLGGIAKGFMTENAKSVYLDLEAKGLLSVMSDIYAIGKKADDTSYNIAITNPRKKETNNDFFAVVEMADTGISSSGDYERYYEYQGRRYSHIIGKDGYPVNDLISVSVMTNSPTLNDCYSTALMVMGMEKAIEFAKENNINCIIINNKFQYAIIGDVKINQSYGINKGYSLYE